MTSEREAKIWMVAAGAVVVWACTMVGCTAVPSDERVTARSAWTTPIAEADMGIAPTITVSPNTAAARVLVEPEASSELIEAAGLLPASQPDFILLRPRSSDSPRFDFDLRGLSIAEPLVSAKRLLVAAVSALPPVPVAEWDRVISSVMHAELADRPVTASLGLSQRLIREEPASTAASMGVADMGGRSLTPAPWETDPTPTPAVSARLDAEEAKFDSAGVIAIVLGAMMMLFGGEAVVLWVKQRRREAQRRAAAALAIASVEQEESIFRFPEPILSEEEESYSKAA
ncbi:MAG: hypothetical protein AAGH99_12085 [Planctomycetota bacterium]